MAEKLERYHIEEGSKIKDYMLFVS